MTSDGGMPGPGPGPGAAQVPRTRGRATADSRRSGIPWRFAVITLLVLLVFGAFLPALGNGFVATWDDGPNLLENVRFRGLGAAELGWAWRTTLLGVYQPLAWMLFSTEHEAWGLAPWGYHLVSIAWHAATTVVVYLLIDRLLAIVRPGAAASDRMLGAALGAALFAVHPLRVEVVAWASCQPYLPCAFTSLLAVLLYVRAQTSGPRRRLVASSWFLLLTALLFKSLAVTLPVVLLVLDAYPLRRLVGRQARWVWLEKLPFLALSASFGLVALLARRAHEVVADRRGLTARAAQAGDAVVFYLVKTAAPFDLTPFHPIPSRAELNRPGDLVGAGVVAVLSVALVVMRKRWPAGLAAWCTYLALLAPQAGLVRSGPMAIADRYSYLATLSLFVLAGAGLGSLRVLERPRPATVAAASVALVLVVYLLPLTWRQCRVWRGSEAVWEHAASHFARAAASDPGSADARHNLGVALSHCQRSDEAEDEFRAAIRLDPGLAGAHGSLGQTLAQRGRLDEALAELSEAVRLDPGSADLHGGRGLLLLNLGRLQEAQADYEAARRLDPAGAEWHAGLGVALYRQGRLDEAQKALAEAFRLRPDDPLILDHLRRVRRARSPG